MGSWTKDGTQRASHIFEAAAWRYAIRPVCRCGHSAAFNPHGLWWYFQRRMRDDHLGKARAHFWCRPCAWRTGRRVRPIRLELVKQSVEDIELEFPPDHEWKRAVSRYRC